MRKIFEWIFHFVFVIILTVFSQVGGLFYLLGLFLSKRLKFKSRLYLVIPIGLYFFCALVALPLISPFFGREALPLSGNIRPLNIITCLLNRHYVRADLKREIQRISDQMSDTYSGTKTNYLDAGFPFFDGFPLFPHLSHNDGKKLDLSFYYYQESERSDTAPGFLGYGVYDGPSSNEVDYPKICFEKGYWQYGILSLLAPGPIGKNYSVDVERTTQLILLLAESKRTSRIFIEPHLKVRWNLGNQSKVRYHGCQAVRHDDHIHVQIN